MPTTLPIPKATDPVLRDKPDAIHEIYRRYFLSLPGFQWGTYIPTYTHKINVATITAGPAMFTQVGNLVTVAGQVTITATAGATPTMADLSLPVTTTLTVSTQCAGLLATDDVAGACGTVVGDVTHDLALVSYVAPDTSAHLWVFQFTYQVVS